MGKSNLPSPSLPGPSSTPLGVSQATQGQGTHPSKESQVLGTYSNTALRHRGLTESCDLVTVCFSGKGTRALKGEMVFPRSQSWSE